MMRMTYFAFLSLAALLPAGIANSQNSSDLIVEKNGSFTNFRVSSIEDQQRFKEIRAKPLDDAVILKWLTEGRNELPTPYLFELSRRLLASNPKEAVRWYMIAMARLRYDAYRCTDDTVYRDGGFLMKWVQQYQEVPEYVRANSLPEEQLNVRGDAELFKGTASPIDACSHGMGAIMAASRGEKPDPAKALRPETQWEAIRTWLSGKGPKPDFI